MRNSRRLFSTAPHTPPSSPSSSPPSPSPPSPPSLATPLPHFIPPLHTPRRVLRVFTLSGLTPFLTTYILQKRVLHHRLTFTKSIDTLLSHLNPTSYPSLTPPTLARLQSSLTSALVNEEKDHDVLLISQPHPIYTMGRNAKLHHLLSPTLPSPTPCFDLPSALSLPPLPPLSLLRLDRGGEVTYHGPGQLLIYPLINLTHLKPDLHLYLRLLESAVISTCYRLGVDSRTPVRSDGQYTGVWREGRKLAAVGVGCSRWLTQHGVAFNVRVDKERYEVIRACGIEEEGRGVGNVMEEVMRDGGSWEEGEGEEGMERVKRVVGEEMAKVMGMDMVWEEESIDDMLQRWDEGKER